VRRGAFAVAGRTLLAAAALGLTCALASACARAAAEPPGWTLAKDAQDQVADPGLVARITRALDAARSAGTDPTISKFNVRAATVIGQGGSERTILGGNTEYRVPEAIHGETSLMNHVITAVGPEAARREVGFIAFYGEACGGGGSCGDCRDYLLKTTRWQDLLMVCGQSRDHTIHVDRFAKWIVPEDRFPEMAGEGTGLPSGELATLVQSAVGALPGGIRLFTPAEDHVAVAVLTTTGKVYRAAGADDAAFHYRYPLGAALQQAATERDYFVRAVVVAGEPGRVPHLSYRDRQYGYESSSFNRKRGLPPIRLIVLDTAGGGRRYRVTTFEDALPGAFSTADFMPDAVDRFLGAAAAR
jgi:cytidine deaminase